MKALVYEKYGSPDNLEIREIEKPSPKENEILIKVKAASINSWDWDLLRGEPFLARIDGMSKPRYKILGCDVAGMIEAVGKDVKKFKEGDEVFGDISGSGWGGFAEYVCANEKALTLKPGGMTFEQAASIPQAGVLGLQGLRFKREIYSGEKILINGAGGGVGTLALQIAKSAAAEVTCVDSSQKLKMLKSLGADYAIDYTKEDFTKQGKTYDRVIDVTANRSIFDHNRVLNRQGLYIIIGGTTSAILQTVFFGAFFSNKQGKNIKLLIHRVNKDMDDLVKYFKSGVMIPIIDKQFPLEQTAEAFKYFGTGNVKGKIIINVN